MSPIGRIFSVLNLVLAALFLGWAVNALGTSDDFKARLDAETAAHETTRTELTDDLASVREEKEEFERQLTLLRTERDDERNRAERLTGELATQTEVNANLRSSVDNISGSIEQLRSQLAQLQEDKDRAVQAQHEADTARREAEQALLAAEQQQNAAMQTVAEREAAIADLERQLTQTRQQASSLETQLATLVDATGVSVAEITSQPLIEGKVTAALYDVEPGLVSLNVGANDNVKRGYVFDVYRGQEYKGQVRVENVREGMSTALIVRTTPGARIAQGDDASTRL